DARAGGAAGAGVAGGGAVGGGRGRRRRDDARRCPVLAEVSVMANDAPQSRPVPVPLGGGPPPRPAPPRPPILYPDSDGKPMSDNTKQARWISMLYGNLSALYRGRPDVFVAADLLWYPVEGQPNERTAPDALVVFGRPK